jgi:hypothetical protein
VNSYRKPPGSSSAQGAPLRLQLQCHTGPVEAADRVALMLLCLLTVAAALLLPAELSQRRSRSAALLGEAETTQAQGRHTASEITSRRQRWDQRRRAKADDDDVGLLAPQHCTARAWTAIAESPPTGRNKPKTCPGCDGQNVSCSGCGNIVPLYHLALSTGARAVASALAFQRKLPAGSPAAIMPMYSPEGTGRSANRPGWSYDPGGDFDGLVSAFGTYNALAHETVPAVSE